MSRKFERSEKLSENEIYPSARHRDLISEEGLRSSTGGLHL